MNNSEERFYMALSEMVQQSKTAPEEATAKLRKAILEYGSETPDNTDCADRLVVAEYMDAGTVFNGPVLASTGVAISAVLNFAEGCPVPDQVSEMFPGISQGDWDAVLRLCTLLLSSLDRKNA